MLPDLQRESETQPWKTQTDYGAVPSAPVEGGHPCCVVWTPIHPITWFLPFVGHMGICDSSGRLHDWGGGPIAACHPRKMMFGVPCRYIKFNPRDISMWDAAIEDADNRYLQKVHCMLCGSDCHSHVADALNNLRYWGCACHNKVELAVLMFFGGSHTSFQVRSDVRCLDRSAGYLPTVRIQYSGITYQLSSLTCARVVIMTQGLPQTWTQNCVCCIV
jgi:hypothetical protein